MLIMTKLNVNWLSLGSSMVSLSFNQYLRIKDLQNQISQLESSNTYRQEVIRLEAALENQEKVQREQEVSIEGKDKKIENLEKKLDEMKSDRNEMVDLESKKEATIRNLKLEIETRSEAMLGLETNYVGLRKERDKMEELIRDKEISMKKLEEEVANRKEKEESLEENIDFSRNENAKLKSTIKLMKQGEKNAELTCKNQVSEELAFIREDIKALKDLINTKLDCQEINKVRKTKLSPSAPIFTISSTHFDGNRKQPHDQSGHQL